MKTHLQLHQGPQWTIITSSAHMCSTSVHRSACSRHDGFVSAANNFGSSLHWISTHRCLQFLLQPQQGPQWTIITSSAHMCSTFVHRSASFRHDDGFQNLHTRKLHYSDVRNGDDQAEAMQNAGSCIYLANGQNNSWSCAFRTREWTRQDWPAAALPTTPHETQCTFSARFLHALLAADRRMRVLKRASASEPAPVPPVPQRVGLRRRSSTQLPHHRRASSSESTVGVINLNR